MLQPSMNCWCSSNFFPLRSCRVACTDTKNPRMNRLLVFCSLSARCVYTTRQFHFVFFIDCGHKSCFRMELLMEGRRWFIAPQLLWTSSIIPGTSVSYDSLILTGIKIFCVAQWYSLLQHIFANRIESIKFTFLYKLNQMWKRHRFLSNAPAQNRPPDSRLPPNADSSRPHHSLVCNSCYHSRHRQNLL
jgi:hypothetical protein